MTPYRAQDDGRDKTPANGGPAFPVRLSMQQFSGMSLRAYFAAQALPACIAVCSNDYRGGWSYEQWCANASLADGRCAAE